MFYNLLWVLQALVTLMFGGAMLGIPHLYYMYHGQIVYLFSVKGAKYKCIQGAYKMDFRWKFAQTIMHKHIDVFGKL